MKLRYLWPKGFSDKIVSLSREGKVRLSWIDWHYSSGRNARLTCRHFGISPDTFYLWKNRFNPGDLSTLLDNKKTRRPHTVREMTTPLWIQRKIYEVRSLDLEKSKYEIQAELRGQGILVGQTAIQKVINRHSDLLNAQNRKRIKAQRKRTIARLKAERVLRERNPGSLVQIDTKHLYILGKRFYLFVAVDCFSRMGYVSCFDTGSSLSASLFLKEALNYFPFQVEAVQTDNGAEYLLNLHKACQENKITHYFIDPYCPKQNGRVERLIQTATYEFFNYQEDLLDDVQLIREACVRFNHKYNYQRFHQALKYQTPVHYLQQRQVYVI